MEIHSLIHSQTMKICYDSLVSRKTKRLMKKLFVPLIAVSMMASLTAEASIFINENFDPSLSAGANFASYGPGGDGTSANNGIVAGVGTGGTSAWQIQMTAAAGGSAGYAYYGAQYQNGGVVGATDPNLADYTISFDAMATGGGSLNLQIQTWTGAGFGGSMTGTLNTAPTSPGYGNDLTLNSTYTHYSLNFADSSVFKGVGAGFSPAGGTYQIAFQLNGPGAGASGYTETLEVDNLQVSVVPEPTILALSGMGISLAGMLIRRRIA